MPKVSIILPTYNRRSMLPRAYASVLAQTYTDFELLIVVDGSPPDYADFVSTLEHGPVRVLLRAENGGPAKARNLAITQARGELLAFLDDDDEFAPGFLAASLARIDEAGPRVAMSWCSAATLDYTAGSTEPSGRRIKRLPAHYDSDETLLQAFLAVGIGSGIVIRGDALDAVGAFNTDLAVADDSEMFLRLLDRGYWPVPVPDVGITLHNHLQSRMTDISHHDVRVRECAWLIARYRDWFAGYPRILAQFREHMEWLQRELDAKENVPS